MSCVKNYGLLHLSEPRGWRGWGAIKINTTGGAWGKGRKNKRDPEPKKQARVYLTK